MLMVKIKGEREENKTPQLGGRIKVKRKGRGRKRGKRGMISHFEYNLIIMPTPLKMSRLLWESVISMVIMRFVAHAGGGGVALL